MSEAFAAILPGMMYFWILFIGQGPMQEVLDEKNIHTLSRILTAPVSLSQFVLSKLIRCFLLCAAIQLLLLLVSSLAFGIRWGNPVLLGLVTGTSALSMTGLLGLIYSMARTKEQANVLSTIALLICAMVGGSMFPFEQLPHFLQAVGQFSPNRWGILALQIVTKARPLSELVLPVAALTGLGFGGCFAAYWLFHRQLRPAK